MSSTNSHAIGHEIPKSTIIGCYIGLLFLTAVMLILSQVDVDKLGVDWVNLHAIRTTLIMGTALVMGLIVSMFLMGLRYESKLLNLTIFLSNFVFLLIFVLFTWVDTSFRGEVDPTFNEKFNWTSPVKPSDHDAAAGHEAAPAAAHEAAPASAPAAGHETAPAAGHEAAPAAAPADAPAHEAPAKAAAPAAAH